MRDTISNSLTFQVSRAIDLAISRPLIRSKWNWNVAKWLYNIQTFDTSQYDSPTQPVDVIWIDPSEIQRLTGRNWKPWTNRLELIGAVEGGDWDITLMNNAPEYYQPCPEKFSEYFVYTSIEERVKNGIEWEQTELYRRLQKRARSQPNAKVWPHLRKIDTLIQTIQNEGYRSQKELYLTDPHQHSSVLDAMLNEVLVDIGRDGTFLFVDGRHRLAVAKALGIDQVPVFILVRHVKWMENRDRAFHNEISPPAHPDVTTS